MTLIMVLSSGMKVVLPHAAFNGLLAFYGRPPFLLLRSVSWFWYKPKRFCLLCGLTMRASRSNNQLLDY